MPRDYALILLPTLRCNAACDYCFEDRADDAARCGPVRQMTPEQAARIVEKVMDYAESAGFRSLSVYWQGGEIMTLPAAWFAEADRLIAERTAGRAVSLRHFAQSNLLAYDGEWEALLTTMFGGSVGTSMDYPNLHRKLRSAGAEEYTDRWCRSVEAARRAGIHVGVIAVLSVETLRLGAEPFYTRFTRELGVDDFQVNTPFPGLAAVREGAALPLDADELSVFLRDLFDIWMDGGYRAGVRLGPFDSLVNFFGTGGGVLPCIWQHTCADGFVCVGPGGEVSQCDCWVASHPDMIYGNLLGSSGLAEILRTSPARARLRSRPIELVREGECADCEFLAVCHGGCPIRARSVRGDVMARDPYCDVYRNLFRHVQAAVKAQSGSTAQRPLA